MKIDQALDLLKGRYIFPLIIEAVILLMNFTVSYLHRTMVFLLDGKRCEREELVR